MAYVSLTIDHRAIDAFQTNAWLTRFVETLETWRRKFSAGAAAST
jgi:2-oxoglutarate dehydrogenase E2 component (dihydrolipoamide succinyltransferase)